MARLTSILGPLTGSVGGITFTSNKGGQTMRVRATPTRSGTENLQNARANFARSVQQWNKLDSDKKASYRSFAADGSRFNPIKRLNTGNQSGNNAFTSLNNFSANINNSMITGAVPSSASADPIPQGTPVFPQAPNISPLYGMTTQLKNGSELGVTMTFTDIVWNDPKIIEITLKLNGGFGSIPFDPLLRGFYDVNDNRLGFCAYISSYYNSIGDVPKQLYQNMFFATPCYTFTGAIGPTSYFAFTADCTDNFAGSKFGYRAGKFATITVFAYSSEGMGVKLGSLQSLLI